MFVCIINDLDLGVVTSVRGWHVYIKVPECKTGICPIL